ncbi:hypothetical protein [Nocardia sp. NPDC020380]|uniref:hypothetical protein n=1 Tax=Nocardia sp. NPDC020380 TaxID=3364309 RepID=UPI0037A92746
MSTSDHNVPIRPRWRDNATAAQVGMFRTVWVLGGLSVATSVLLVIGAFAADSANGATGQPAALLGLITGMFGASVLIVGVLVRFGVVRSDSRRSGHDH